MTKHEFQIDLTQKPQGVTRVVICGEVNAGKSAVLSALSRGITLPDFFGESWRPSIVLRHADKATAASDPSERSDLCLIEADARHLTAFEIVELPFLKDGEIPDSARQAIAAADILIWVTIASQAWRLSEKSILDALSDERPKHSVLAISRSDKLRKVNDAERIRARVANETSAYFSDIVMMRAGEDILSSAAANHAAWAESGGQALSEILFRMQTEIAATATPPEPPQTAKETAAPEPDPVPSPPAKTADLGTPEKLQAIRAMAETMHGIMAAGIFAEDDPDSLFLLRGDAEENRALAEFFATTLSTVKKHSLGMAGFDDLDSSHVSTRGHQLHCRYFPSRRIFMYMQCQTARMNHGISRTAFQRLSKTYEQSL